MKNNSWHSLITKAEEKGYHLELDIDGIDINEKGSAMKVLNQAKLSKNHYTFFKHNMSLLLDCSNIQTLYGTIWSLEL